MFKLKRIYMSLILGILCSVSLSIAVFAEGSQQGNGDTAFQAVMNTPAAAEKGLVMTSDGNLYYRTTDTQATTNITYATIGLVISDKNNATNGIVIGQDQMSAPASILVPSPNGNGNIYAEARYIGNIHKLAAQLGTTSLRMDCIMETRINGESEGVMYTDADHMALVAEYYQVPLSEIKTAQNLVDKYGWKDKSGILEHFDWVIEMLDLGYTKDQIEELMEKEILEDPENPKSPVVGSGDRENVIASCGGGADHDETPAAEYRTGTESVGNKYCIFEGIPSGKNLNNYFEADKWRD